MQALNSKMSLSLAQTFSHNTDIVGVFCLTVTRGVMS